MKISKSLKRRSWYELRSCSAWRATYSSLILVSWPIVLGMDPFNWLQCRFLNNTKLVGCNFLSLIGLTAEVYSDIVRCCRVLILSAGFCAKTYLGGEWFCLSHRTTSESPNNSTRFTSSPISSGMVFVNWLLCKSLHQIGWALFFFNTWAFNTVLTVAANPSIGQSSPGWDPLTQRRSGIWKE